MSVKLCVIGSNSFTGATCIKYCQEETHEVLGLSRTEDPADCFLSVQVAGFGHFERLQGHGDVS